MRLALKDLTIAGHQWSCPPGCDDDSGIFQLGYRRGERDAFARAPWEEITAHHHSGRRCIKTLEFDEETATWR